MPGRCRFYEFQKAYLKKLVELKFVVIDLEAGLGVEEVEEAWGFGEEEAQSKCAGKNSMEAKIDALISLLKMLILVLFIVCIVAIMYVFKLMVVLSSRKMYAKHVNAMEKCMLNIVAYCILHQMVLLS